MIENYAVDLDHVTRTYKRDEFEVRALDDVTLKIPEQSFVTIMGPSGSGKTTLLNLIAGIDHATSGRVAVGQEQITGMNECALATWRARHIGLVFQFYNLIPVLTAFENVELPLLLTNLARTERKSHVEAALTAVGLADRMRHFPRQLSGGQEQRVAIARAIVAGRMFAPGLDEVIIGKFISNHYPGCSLGSTMRFGRRTWKVVGVFEAGGSSFESETWADLHSLQEDSRRGTSYNSIRLKLVPGADVASLIQRIADDPRINLQAETESDYYREQSAIAGNLRALGLLVAGIMAFGAIFAAMNTMYAAVSARTSEIGTLRALGFGPTAIMTSFLVGSSILAIAAGIFGVILALPINGFSTTFNNAIASTTLAFSFM